MLRPYCICTYMSLLYQKLQRAEANKFTTPISKPLIVLAAVAHKSDNCENVSKVYILYWNEKLSIFVQMHL